MKDIRRLTDSKFISKELADLLEEEKGKINGFMQMFEHGEAEGFEQYIAKDTNNTIRNIIDDPKKQLTYLYLSYENLLMALPVLIAKNNERLLDLFLKRHP